VRLTVRVWPSAESPQIPCSVHQRHVPLATPWPSSCVDRLPKRAHIDHVFIAFLTDALIGLWRIAKGERGGRAQCVAVVISTEIAVTLWLVVGPWGLLALVPLGAAVVVRLLESPAHGGHLAEKRSQDGWEQRSADVAHDPHLDGITASMIVRSASRPRRGHGQGERVA
jgi:hypothetical protein